MDAGFRFAVRVKPGAKREAVGGCWSGALGDALVVAVAAPAVEGKANAALCAALAGAFQVRVSAVRVVRGERGRDKLVELDPAPEGAPDRLRQLRAR
ncbi:hypothetical protein EV191_11665 [Tamaricihabitans halophyticus]|uniref:UPF0235 protein EV191_11665 n=1 Tax=Tamaricihabitans halophyticus TaxID=1262583 RepID=A0A4R2Q945_9PSEU|nr:DUF167 family protein [Tamaricihabitans halophyticus]TCP45423.1 hypothetical protein EV191_11665 [Tamaricihabitans halophyticus]